MSLDHAILGFLKSSPMSGYDLKKIFDVSVRHFWPADLGQIYRTLGRLVVRGWAETEVVEQTAHPNRKVYHITREGKEELHLWLTTPIPFKADREPQLIQVFFAGGLTDEEILTMFKRMAERLGAILVEYDQIPQKSAGLRDSGGLRDNYFWLLTLERGIHAVRAELEWVEDVIRRIRKREHPTG
jgi:PadR family transcriptional regulator AphA